MARTKHTVSAEGADALVLAGVNDVNLVELSNATGVRVTLRGDSVMLEGEPEVMELASRVVSAMVDVARLGESLNADDVRTLIADGGAGNGLVANGNLKIALPGSGRIVQPKTAGQRRYVEAIRQNEIVIGVGPAGTGKTYLAVALGAEALVRKRVRRLILARPAVEAGERLGFLPGDLRDKVDPYLRPLYDALEDILPEERVRRAIETGAIEIAPLGYMRGRTLQDAFVILDEAQNVTSGQMKMFLTRLGVNSRAVVIGDKTQIDLPSREESGLVEIERLLASIDGVAVVTLDDGDVVRHRLVREIIKAYEQEEQSS
ncbi:MAG: PhoH family protein [Gemmatimonadetes bacterium]|nr:PhoH family protein [Gemmatimonadota bacterium]MCZ6759571.1 PhoH family protein [Gemmatimonadota bacterium]